MEKIVQFVLEITNADVKHWHQQKGEIFFDEIAGILKTEKSSAKIKLESTRLILSEMLSDISQSYGLRIINIEDCFEPKEYSVFRSDNNPGLPIQFGHIDKVSQSLDGPFAPIGKAQGRSYLYKDLRTFVGWRVTALTVLNHR